MVCEQAVQVKGKAFRSAWYFYNVTKSVEIISKPEGKNTLEITNKLIIEIQGGANSNYTWEVKKSLPICLGNLSEEYKNAEVPNTHFKHNLMLCAILYSHKHSHIWSVPKPSMINVYSTAHSTHDGQILKPYLHISKSIIAVPHLVIKSAHPQSSIAAN